MSENPEYGMISTWGQIHEIDNLFVSDGSQFTSSLAGNPTLTIVALAIRQSARLNCRADAYRRTVGVACPW